MKRQFISSVPLGALLLLVSTASASALGGNELFQFEQGFRFVPALIMIAFIMVFLVIAATTLTPAVVLGIWYSKANKYGTFAGMSFGLLTSMLCIWGWVAKVPLFSEMGILPATSSALILCPLAFLINIVVSRMTADRVSADSLRRSHAILRKLHNLPGQEEEEDQQRVSVYSH